MPTVRPINSFCQQMYNVNKIPSLKLSGILIGFVSDKICYYKIKTMFRLQMQLISSNV